MTVGSVMVVVAADAVPTMPTAMPMATPMANIVFLMF
jgi:hypothetical protein